MSFVYQPDAADKAMNDLAAFKETVAKIHPNNTFPGYDTIFIRAKRVPCWGRAIFVECSESGKYLARCECGQSMSITKEQFEKWVFLSWKAHDLWEERRRKLAEEESLRRP